MHMGECAEKTATDLSISREDQDKYAISSYTKSAEAWKSGIMAKEVIPVHIPSSKKGLSDQTLKEDEDYVKIMLDKVASLKPAFKSDGTITAANASNLNDGAAALVLMSSESVAHYGLKPLARIISFADASVDPVDFGVAPAAAITKALQYAGQPRVDFYEINEAFSVVALANIKLLSIDPNRINVHGGAVSLGHPLGASGSRIVCSLINVLVSRDGRIGVAGICNGGGGATALCIEKL